LTNPKGFRAIEVDGWALAAWCGASRPVNAVEGETGKARGGHASGGVVVRREWLPSATDNPNSDGFLHPFGRNLRHGELTSWLNCSLDNRILSRVRYPLGPPSPVLRLYPTLALD